MKVDLTVQEMDLILSMIDRCDYGGISYEALRDKIEKCYQEEKKHGTD